MSPRSLYETYPHELSRLPLNPPGRRQDSLKLTGFPSLSQLDQNAEQSGALDTQNLNV